MSDKKPRGYFENILALDTETTGVAIGQLDPTTRADGEYYQMVSAGFIIADVKTFKPIDKLYVEIKWNGESRWESRAEGVHGLSKKYLEKNALSEEDAVVEIGQFLLKHYSPESDLRLLGHNVATFDRYFLSHLFERHGIKLKFGNRHIDSFALGMTLLEAYNSDDLFEALGMQARESHNAMEDTEMTLKAVRMMKKMFLR